MQNANCKLQIIKCKMCVANYCESVNRSAIPPLVFEVLY